MKQISFERLRELMVILQKEEPGLKMMLITHAEKDEQVRIIGTSEEIDRDVIRLLYDRIVAPFEPIFPPLNIN